MVDDCPEECWPRLSFDRHIHTHACVPPHRVHLHTHDLICIHKRISAHIDKRTHFFSGVRYGGEVFILDFFFWLTTDLPSRGGRGANHSPFVLSLARGSGED